MTLAVFIILFLCMVTVLQAQDVYYGGSSYAHMKNSDGKTWVAVSTTPCIHRTEADAKKALMPIKLNGVEFDSPVYYDIDRCNSSESRRYGGSSSVKIRNKDGVVRLVNQTTSCIHATVPDAKKALTPPKLSGEEFVTGITYDISRCD